MAIEIVSLAENHVGRVRRRIFWQNFLDRLPWFWTAGLGATAVWCFFAPLLHEKPSMASALTVAGILIALGTLVAGYLAWRKSPDPIAAALVLDDRFGLRERVTTWMTLDAGQRQTAAGQALESDLGPRLGSLNLNEKFPLRLSSNALGTSLGMGVLALLAFLFAPSWNLWSNDPGRGSKVVVADPEEVQRQLENLKRAAEQRKKDDLPKSEKLKELEDAWDKLIQQPVDPKNPEQVKERLRELRTLEERMKDRMAELKKDKAGAAGDLKSQLEKLASTDGKGPGKELQDALSKGKFDKAQEILDKLTKDLKNDKLSPSEKKNLADQLQEMHKELKRLAEKQDLKDELQKAFKDGKIDKEQLERELEQLAQQMGDLQELNDLANLLGECQQCLGKGNLEAAEKLEALLEKLKSIEDLERELADLQRSLEMLGEA